MNTNTTPSQPQSNITYVVGQYQTSDRTVEVVYTRESDGFIYKRGINIPHFEDGSVDENYFQEILDSQLSGVINKFRVGAITFIDPSQENVGIAST